MEDRNRKGCTIVVLFILLAIIVMMTLWSLREQQIVRGYSVSFVKKVMHAATETSVVVTILFYGLILGIAVRMFLHLVFNEQDFSIWIRVSIGVASAIFFSAVYVWVFKQALSIPDTWLRSQATKTWFGVQYWNGVFDRSPVWWSVPTFFLYLLSYFLIFNWVVAFLDKNQSSQGVGNPG